MRWSLALVAAAVGCADIEVIEDASYDDRYGFAVMDVYVPEGAVEPGPAVMLVHGGGWAAGDKRDLAWAARRFARAGYVAASINYRLAPDDPFPASSRDVACALSELRARGGELAIDPDRIAVYGYSAGGHLVSLLAVATGMPELEPDCDAGPTGPPAAVISGAGPQDLRRYRDWPGLTGYLGGGQDEIPEIWAAASPVTHVDPGEPPFLLIHGNVDLLVGADQGEVMREALAAAGNDVRLMRLRGAGHLAGVTGTGTASELSSSIDHNQAWLAVFDLLERTIGVP